MTPASDRPADKPAPAFPPEKIRLSKLMADRGLCSRREADRLIEQGWVRVDGVTISELGSKVYPTQSVSLEPAARRELQAAVTILLNKPVGYVSGQPEKGYLPAVALIVPNNHLALDPSGIRFQPSHLQGLAPAGRLDIDSKGLLVFTQDGRVARRLIGENSEVDKEYRIWVEGKLTGEALARLRHGLSLDQKPLRPAGVEVLQPGELKFVLREGRKRQIRRMCDLVGLKVVGLKRVRIGRVHLGNLPEGQWRYLGRNEEF